MKNLRAKWLDILELAIRINIFLKLLNYGIGKIIGGQFYKAGNIPESVGNTLLKDVGSYDLAWTFFGHSDGYILCIGISQLIAATLLLINRTKIIGALLLIPILLNIILVDVFYKVAYGALFSACFYLAGALFVLIRNKKVLMEALRRLLLKGKKILEVKGKVLYYTLTVVGVAVIFLIELYFIGLFGYTDP